MNVYLYDVLQKLGYYRPGYQEGLIAGIIVVIAIIIILRLIIILFTPSHRRSQGVYAKGEGGAIFVSSMAISDLINALECEFDGIKFSKTTLFKKKSKYYIKILADLETKEINFPDLVGTIRNRIFDSLSKNLGIDCIEKINIHLRKVKG